MLKGPDFMFENAKWIRFKTDTVNIKNKYNPVPYIAKSFTVKSGLKSAMLHICTASEAAYFLNGTAILNSYRPSCALNAPQRYGLQRF